MASSETVRVETLSDDDRALVNILTPEERRVLLVDGARVKAKRLAGQD